MKRYLGLAMIAALALAAVLGFASTDGTSAQITAHTANYSVDNLGPMGAIAINSSGQVAGTSIAPDGSMPHHAVRYTDGIGIVDLGTLPGDTVSQATAINASGQVAGWSRSADGSQHGFRYTDGIGMVDLGTLPGDNDVAVWDINDAGQVVGSSMHRVYTSTGSYWDRVRAFRYTDGLGMVDLGTLGGAISEARGINASGQVAGYSYTADGKLHAFRYTDGPGMVDLGTLTRDKDGRSVAYDINDSGQVVGYTSSGRWFRQRPFRYTDGVGMVDLGTLGGSQGWAMGINNLGDVVGAAATAAGDYPTHAFRYADGVGMEDLNSLIEPVGSYPALLRDAWAINDVRQILPGFNSYRLSPSSPPAGAPAPPTDLSAQAVSTSSIDLAWTDSSGNETGFRIERKGPDGWWTFVATVGPNAQSFRVTGLARDTLYYFRVRAENPDGASAFSNVASVRTKRR